MAFGQGISYSVVNALFVDDFKLKIHQFHQCLVLNFRAHSLLSQIDQTLVISSDNKFNML